MLKIKWLKNLKRKIEIIKFSFSLLKLDFCLIDKFYYLDFICINTNSYIGSLLYIGYINDHWEFDFLFLRALYFKLIINKLNKHFFQ